MQSEASSYDRLKNRLSGMGGVLVAFSGGVDSSLLVAAARDALGEKMVAVTASSPTYSAEERERACSLAKTLGVRHIVIETNEFEINSFRSNPKDRCYYCKLELYGVLRGLADREGLPFVIDGFNRDDRSDHRPGHQAAREYGVRSPLDDLGFGKDEIRKMARERGLPNWDQPACACLASRIPYGQEITPLRLERILGAETAIRSLGFRVVRVRDHGDLARIEIGRDELDLASRREFRDSLAQACKQHGYTYACLDLDGYRTGAMNEAIGIFPKQETDV
jgi:uncharacterized protein